MSAFPAEIFGLADTLEVLDLGFNHLDRLPDNLPHLTRLRALFCSGNPFLELPPVLGDCGALTQVGFRDCGLTRLSAEALPSKLRWLTLTNNALDTLPDAIGNRPLLRKAMFSGNRLRTVPDSLADAPNLELLRLAANRFETLPTWLDTLPRLAWLACAGNPAESAPARSTGPIPWSELELGDLLGEGASGKVHRALWRGVTPEPVAVKLFKGAMTSDGLPDSEMAACLAAGAHPNLSGALGHLTGHPEGLSGLIMPLIEAHWRVLAGPPSLESCSRDIYASDFGLRPEALLALAANVGRGAARLHEVGLMHGDLYAHNVLWDGVDGRAVLSDFGGASFMPPDRTSAFQRLDVRAFGILLGELTERCDSDLSAEIGELQRACVQPDVKARPPMADVLGILEGVGRG